MYIHIMYIHTYIYTWKISKAARKISKAARRDHDSDRTIYYTHVILLLFNESHTSDTVTRAWCLKFGC